MASIARARMTAVAFIAAAAAILISLLITFIWAFQERIAFQPPGGPWPDAGAARVDYTAQDGQRLFAYVVGDRSAPNGLLLSFHGNADLAVWQIDWAEEINRRSGVTVMLAEYRGYMGLGGQPAYAGSRLDADAAYLYARDSLRIPATHIALFGHSLGTAVAAELAARHRPAALLLQSPFTSARDMAGRMTGYTPADFLWRLISRIHFNTVARVGELDAPVSVVHGGNDRLIPVKMGEEVFASAKVKGAWLLVPGAAHNDVELVGGDAYWGWLISALMVLPEAQRNP